MKCFKDWKANYMDNKIKTSTMIIVTVCSKLFFLFATTHLLCSISLIVFTIVHKTSIPKEIELYLFAITIISTVLTQYIKIPVVDFFEGQTLSSIASKSIIPKVIKYYARLQIKVTYLVILLLTIRCVVSWIL